MKRWYWLIPPLLAMAVYAPAPWGELVWDDAFVLDRQLVAFKSITDVFFPPDGIFQWSQNYYRPIVILSYMLDVSLYGDARTAGMHLSNVFYHTVTTFFIWLLAQRLLRHLPNGSVGAILAAAIFAVHPIHTESVSWITGRSDVLAAIFFVPSVTLALLWRDTGAKWALALATMLYMLAILSKEVAIAALIVVPAALLLTPPLGGIRTSNKSGVIEKDLLTHSPPDFQFHTNIGMWLAAAIAYLGVTGLYLMLRYTDGIAYGVSLQVPWLEYALRLERSLAYYLVKVFVPWPQSSHVAWDLTPGSIASNAAFLIGLGILWLSIRFWRRHRDGSLLLAMIWFGATLAPSVLVAVRHISGLPLAERYLYLPSAGLALAIGVICCQPYIGKWFKPALWAAILLVMAYSVATVERGIVWSSNLSLWTDATQKAPRHGGAWNFLGIAYYQQDNYEQAMDAFQHAIDAAIGPSGRSYAKRNIALIYVAQNDLQQAKEYFTGALDDLPANPEAHYGLGAIYATEAKGIRNDGGRKDRISASLGLAVNHFESALQLNPFHTEARWGLASVLAQQGQDAEADRKLQQATALYRSALAAIDTLIVQDPAFGGANVDIRSTRAGIKAALRRLGG